MELGDEMPSRPGSLLAMLRSAVRCRRRASQALLPDRAPESNYSSWLRCARRAPEVGRVEEEPSQKKVPQVEEKEVRPKPVWPDWYPEGKYVHDLKHVQNILIQAYLPEPNDGRLPGSKVRYYSAPEEEIDREEADELIERWGFKRLQAGWLESGDSFVMDLGIPPEDPDTYGVNDTSTGERVDDESIAAFKASGQLIPQHRGPEQPVEQSLLDSPDPAPHAEAEDDDEQRGVPADEDLLDLKNETAENRDLLE